MLARPGLVVQVIARVLRTLLEGIAALDAKITEAAEAHPDLFIFQSFPRAGAALASRLLAALGSQRDRYGSAEEVQEYQQGGRHNLFRRCQNRWWKHRGRLQGNYAQPTATGRDELPQLGAGEAR